MKHATFFDHVHQIIDSALCFLFNSFKKMNPVLFAKGHKEVLGMYCRKDDLENVLKSLDANCDPEPKFLAPVLEGCEITKVLFAGCQSRMYYILYVEEIEKRVIELGQQDFLVDEVASFTKLMTQEARSLEGVALKDFQKKKGEVVLFD